MKKKKKVKIIKELDLHGSTQIEAENLLYDFLIDIKNINFREVRIITGYGLNSPDGRSVIKDLTERILIEKGIEFEYLEGRGIFEIKIDSVSSTE
jgi:DNA-nicking Smr family endonuclease